MMIARIPEDEGSAAAGRTFGVIGSCRVHNPVQAMVKSARLKRVWREFNAFTHGPMEALQYFRFARGEVDIPDSFAPYIFSVETTPQRDEALAEAVRQIDFMIVEISSFARLNCGLYEFQQNYFSEHFVRRGGIDFLEWWRNVSQRNPAAVSSADQLVEMRRAGDKTLRPSEEEIVRTLQFREFTDDELIERIMEMARDASLPLILVPHFSFDTEDNPISAMRLRNRRVVKEAARHLGAGFFDPTDELLAYGREKALKNDGRDIYHYSPEFDGHVGSRILEVLPEVGYGMQ